MVHTNTTIIDTRTAPKDTTTLESKGLSLVRHSTTYIRCTPVCAANGEELGQIDLSIADSHGTRADHVWPVAARSKDLGSRNVMDSLEETTILAQSARTEIDHSSVNATAVAIGNAPDSYQHRLLHHVVV